MATNAQAALEGQPWNQATLDAALLAVAKDVNISPDAPGLLPHSLSAFAADVAIQIAFASACAAADVMTNAADATVPLLLLLLLLLRLLLVMSCCEPLCHRHVC